MIFEEYALTPRLFDADYLMDDRTKEFILATILRDMKSNGIVADMNAAKWHEIVSKKLEDLPQSSKDRIEKLLECLHGRNRIVPHDTIVKDVSDDEKDWLETALEEDRLKPYYAILHGEGTEIPHERTFTLTEFLDSERWSHRKQSHVFVQSEMNLRNYLTDFLIYAKKLEIVDPYMNPIENRYRRSLEIMLSLLGKRRGKKMRNRPVIVHTRCSENHDKTGFRKNIKKILQELRDRYKHDITMKCWKDESKKWHDRFLLTDQGAVTSSTGMDIRTKNESIWTTIDYEDIGKMIVDFRENSSPFILKHVFH